MSENKKKLKKFATKVEDLDKKKFKDILRYNQEVQEAYKIEYEGHTFYAGVIKQYLPYISSRYLILTKKGKEVVNAYDFKGYHFKFEVTKYLEKLNNARKARKSDSKIVAKTLFKELKDLLKKEYNKNSTRIAGGLRIANMTMYSIDLMLRNNKFVVELSTANQYYKKEIIISEFLISDPEFDPIRITRAAMNSLRNPNDMLRNHFEEVYDLEKSG